MCVLKPGRALSRMQILFVCSTLSKQCARVSRRVGKVLAARCALAGASDGPYHLRWTDSSGRGDTVQRVSRPVYHETGREVPKAASCVGPALPDHAARGRSESLPCRAAAPPLPLPRGAAAPAGRLLILVHAAAARPRRDGRGSARALRPRAASAGC